MPADASIDLPPIGFGTHPMKGDEATRAVAQAIAAGYRLVDTAVNYDNEEAVGRGVAESGVDPAEVIVTTKLPGRDHGYDETKRSFEASREALGLEAIDLYLIHWPNPSVGKYVDSWRAMVELQRDGRARAIGVSNFTQEHLTRIGDETGVLPVVNQVELHPHFPQADLRAFHDEHGITTEAWSPLGRFSELAETEAIAGPAADHGITPAQVVLRWQLQIGALPIPKSADPDRQRQNLAVLDVELAPEEVDAIAALGRPDGRLFGGDPNSHEEM